MNPVFLAKKMILTRLGITPLREQVHELQQQLRSLQQQTLPLQQLVQSLQQQVQSLQRQVQAQQQQHELEQAEKNRARWVGSLPDPGLTWGKHVSGTDFVATVRRHYSGNKTGRILEVGPGYGRILGALLEHQYPFAAYYGLDISPANISHLKQRFHDPRCHFLCHDINSIELPEPVDMVLSSLTFKHLYPTFLPALQNICRFLAPGARLFFDLTEGQHRYFEPNPVTYIREYSRTEIAALLAATDLELVGFDTVRHDRQQSRLLVIARKAGPT